jgi:hypothetical protein
VIADVPVVSPTPRPEGRTPKRLVGRVLLANVGAPAMRALAYARVARHRGPARGRRRGWARLLHNQRALYIKRLLLFEPHVILSSVPYQLFR